MLDQSFQDFEIVITDDGSNDETVAEIRQFTDPRIKFFAFEKNHGACVAVNNCIRNVSGEYIAGLCSDDMFLPEKLETQVKFLDEHPDIAAVFTHVRFIDEVGLDILRRGEPDTNIFSQPNRTRFEWLNHFFYKGNCLCSSSVLIRSRIFREIGLYDQRLAQLADWDFWVRLCLQSEIHVMPEKLVLYRIRDNMANASAARPEVLIRATWEHRQVLNHFLKIDRLADFLRIFPECAKMDIAEFDADYAKFLLATLAVESKDTVKHWFGLDMLYDLLGSGAAGRICEKFKFSYADFIKLSGMNPLFNYNKFALKRSEEEREKLSRQLRAIQGSRTWRWTAGIRAIENVLGSFNRRGRK